MAQFIFQWPAKASYASEDFIPSASNETALRMLQTWPEQGSGTALLFGPAASGKTHLAQCWAARVGAVTLDAALLGTVTSEQLWGDAHYAVLENIDSVRDEAALFHLLRHTELHKLALLMTARSDAKQLPFTLPDLRSRLLALPVAELQPPDETLLEGFLMKYFSDRQLRVEGDVISYIAKRVERSFASAASVAEAIERASTEAKREITIPFVRSFIE
jgi:chromosomal replication initiation ATPase DnaA